MGALKPSDRRLLDRLQTLADSSTWCDIQFSDLAAVLKLVRRLARRIDGPGSKQQSKRNREKGQELQREVANALQNVYPDARNNPQYRGAKRDGADVEGTAFWIEAKNLQDGSVFAFYRQAMRDKAKAEDTRPVLIATTRNREPVLVAMHLATFVGLLEAQL